MEDNPIKQSIDEDGEITAVRIRKKDLKKLDFYKLDKNQAYWEVIKRIINEWESKENYRG